jgi:uncharacterized membrane protein YeaQ/YmgE (transglycosylase-associated protein family)
MLINVFAWIVLGLIAGFIASMLVNKRGEGMVLDIVLGIVGAIVGGWVFHFFGSAGGTGERRSLKAGVDKFMALTHPLHGVTVCDPVIQEHLERIQRDIRRSGDRKGMIGGTPALAHLSGTHGQLPRSFAKPRTGGLK